MTAAAIHDWSLDEGDGGDEGDCDRPLVGSTKDGLAIEAAGNGLAVVAIGVFVSIDS